MSEYIVDFDWMREYERNIERLIGEELEYDDATNPTPPLLERNKVTRCRDCKHLVAYPDAKYCAGLSSAFFEVSDENFCAWAVRRDA